MILKVYCHVSHREMLWLGPIPLGRHTVSYRAMLSHDEALRLVAEGKKVWPVSCRKVWSPLGLSQAAEETATVLYGKRDRGHWVDSDLHTRIHFDDSLPVIPSNWP